MRVEEEGHAALCLHLSTDAVTSLRAGVALFPALDKGRARPGCTARSGYRRYFTAGASGYSTSTWSTR